MKRPVDAHIGKILALVDVPAIMKQRFRVTLDTINGAGGPISRTLLEKLGCAVYGINLARNGKFAHMPEPTPKNLGALATLTARKKADIGFALDPDADRLVLVGPDGTVLVEEYTLAIAVWHHLAHIGRGPVVINQSTSRMSEDIAARYACPCYRSKVGEWNVMTEMMRRKAAIGGEGNGGIMDPRLHRNRDGIFGMALILEAMTVSGKTLPQILELIPRYFIVKETMPLEGIPFAHAKKSLAAAYPDAERTATDGVRFAWTDRWLHVRSSNTEPIVRIIAEAPKKKDALAMIAEAKKAIAALR